MAQLFLSRKNQLAAKFQSFALLVNGHKVGTIKQEDKILKELEAGKYTFQVRKGEYSSLPLSVELKDNDSIYLQVSSHKYASLIIISWVIVTAMLVATYKIEGAKNFIMPLAMLLSGLTFYFKFIRRKKYLSIEQSSTPFKG